MAGKTPIGGSIGQQAVQATSPGRHIGATSRISAQNLSLMAQQLGRCGAINEITGYVCVTQPHDDDVEHMSMFIGGPRDGQVTSTWGGRKQNTGVILTKKVPDA
jgi:hypothetical protein